MLGAALLRGRCRTCGCPIPALFSLVEVAAGVIFVLVYRRFGATPDVLPALILLAGLLVAAAIDWEHGLIPNELNAALAIVGLGLALLDGVPGILMSLFGGVVGGGLLLGLSLVGRLVFRRPSVGGGDVKLAMAIGIFVGWMGFIDVLMAASLIGAAIGLVLKLANRIKPFREVPFAPMLFAGTAWHILFPGSPIWRMLSS